MEDIFNSFIVNTYFAHRGLWDENVPENSLAAYSKAMEKGYGIELDVHDIIDGTPVCFHDDKLSRLTGKDGYINKLKESDLKDYKLNGTNQHIPTLKEALELIDGKVPVIIEIKNNFRPSILEKNILELLKTYKGEVAIVSFNPFILKWFKDNAPHIMRGQNSCYFNLEHDKIIPFFKRLILKRMWLNSISDPHFISYQTDNLPNFYVKKRRNKKLPLLAWPVTNQQEYNRVMKYVDNIIFENFEPKV